MACFHGGGVRSSANMTPFAPSTDYFSVEGGGGGPGCCVCVAIFMLLEESVDSTCFVLLSFCKHPMIVLSLFTFDSLSPCRTNRNLQPIDVNHRAANGGSPKPRHKRGSSTVSVQTTSSKDSSSTVTSSNSAKASTISLR